METGGAEGPRRRKVCDHGKGIPAQPRAAGRTERGTGLPKDRARKGSGGPD